MQRQASVPADNISDVRRHIREKTGNNTEEMKMREAVKTRFGFDPATAPKVLSPMFQDMNVTHSCFVNASLRDLEKRPELTEVRHGSLTQSRKLNIANKTGSSLISSAEIVYDSTHQPCRKVITTIEVAEKRNELVCPIGARFSGFTCRTTASSPYSNETFDLMLEPHTGLTNVSGHVLYQNPFSTEEMMNLVADWGPVTQDRIASSFRSRSTTVHEVNDGSLIHQALHDDKFKHELVPGSTYDTYMDEKTQAPVHVVAAEISQKVVDHIQTQLDNAPFYDMNKIGVKYFRADGAAWTSTSLAGPSGVVISDLTNHGKAVEDPLSETSHFGVGLKITFKLVPIASQ